MCESARSGGDHAGSSIPSPLGTIHASWYSIAMTSQHHAGLSMLGENVYHGRRSLISITQADRLGHMWVLGKTGTGTSSARSARKDEQIPLRSRP